MINNLNEAIKSSNDLAYYLKLKAESHNYYKLYSTFDRIMLIKNNKEIYLSDGSNWNDILDKNNFNCNNYEKKNFGMCFSYSRSESVAMWMLYGGINKENAMIDFTRSAIKNILNIDKIDVGYFDNYNFISQKTLNKKDFNIFATDVIYYENGNHYKINRNRENVENVKKDIVDNIAFCKKTSPWNYENECRLIVQVDKSKLNDEDTHVKINISDVDLGTTLNRIYRGPNCTLPIDESINDSKLANTIDWDLRKSCKYCMPNMEEDINNGSI